MKTVAGCVFSHVFVCMLVYGAGGLCAVATSRCGCVLECVLACVCAYVCVCVCVYVCVYVCVCLCVCWPVSVPVACVCV